MQSASRGVLSVAARGVICKQLTHHTVEWEELMGCGSKHGTRPYHNTEQMVARDK